ncbi:MAG: dihydroorotate dehydrogenase (quinone), partial [Pseudomonadales bacterium]
MYSLIQKLLFCLPTEVSHRVSLTALDVAAQLKIVRPSKQATATPIKVMGLEFPNRIGLAAGLDKDAEHIDGLAALGFGFLEIGTVTPLPQPGSPKPRLFRLPSAEAIINRMGFNNKGVLHALAQIERARFDGVLGINIGKNKDTAAERAVEDYVTCMRQAYNAASYITVNLSSPNTPGLRDLQFGEALRRLLETLKEQQRSLAAEHGCYKPLLVKIAPDLAADDIVQLGQVLLQFQIDGVIATNTTVIHEAVQGLKHGAEAGGLSGRPLAQRSTEVIQALHAELGGKIPIIASGGVMDIDTAE